MFKFFRRHFRKKKEIRPMTVERTENPRIFKINGIRILTVSRETALMITKPR